MRCLVLSLLLLASAGVVHAFPNEPSGFRSFDWDDPFDRHQVELVPVEDGKGADFYARRDKNLTLGRVKLESLSYAFQQGKFVGVVFRTAGEANEKALVEYLNGEYGKGERRGNPMEFGVVWAGSKSRIEISCQSKSVCSGYIASAKAYAAYAAQNSRPPARGAPKSAGGRSSPPK